MIKHIVHIYKLECTKTGRIYIGKSSAPSLRKDSHMSLLHCGKHHVELMQSDYDKYGADAFVFTVLESVERVGHINKHGRMEFSDSQREKELMIQFKTFLPEYGYNYKDPHFQGARRRKKEV